MDIVDRAYNLSVPQVPAVYLVILAAPSEEGVINRIGWVSLVIIVWPIQHLNGSYSFARSPTANHNVPTWTAKHGSRVAERVRLVPVQVPHLAARPSLENNVPVLVRCCNEQLGVLVAHFERQDAERAVLVEAARERRRCQTNRVSCGFSLVVARFLVFIKASKD